MTPAIPEKLKSLKAVRLADYAVRYFRLQRRIIRHWDKWFDIVEMCPGG